MIENFLSLHVPEYGELYYRQKILRDPETMSYNAGYDLGFEGYDDKTGCIEFPECEWGQWYEYFVGQEPARFYAFIVKSNGEFIGEVNLHNDDDGDIYNMGIVLEAKHRGKGYAEQALKLLLKHAFEKMGAKAVINEFEEERLSAVKAHLNAGFTKVKTENGISKFIITRENYFGNK